MGSKKKKTTTVITTIKTQLVKLSYIQTLAISQQLTSAAAETETPKGSGPGASSSESKGSTLGLILFGLKKSSKSTTSETKTTGAKIKDFFLQPYFDRIRYGIGIREMSVSKYKFAPASEFISVPFLSPKEVVKIHVLVDEYIPPQFDTSTIWIRYFIKVEGDSEWIRVNPTNASTRFDEAGEIIPKIINFNLPKPTTSKLEDKFNFTEEPVKKVRFRAVLTRPEGGDNDSITPMLKSYRVMMIPRG